MAVLMTNLRMIFCSWTLGALLGVLNLELDCTLTMGPRASSVQIVGGGPRWCFLVGRTSGFKFTRSSGGEVRARYRAPSVQSRVVNCMPDSTTRILLRFRVEIIKTHRSSFNRLVHEAVEIRRGGQSLLNSKEEYCRNLLPNLQLEATKSHTKQDPGPEVLPWYVDKEVDKPDAKNRTPGDLKKPSPKRRRVSKAKVNKVTDYWTPVEVCHEVQERDDEAPHQADDVPHNDVSNEDQAPHQADDVPHNDVINEGQAKGQEKHELQVPRDLQDKIEVAQGAPPVSGVSEDTFQNTSKATPGRQPVNTCATLGWNLGVHTPEAGVEQVLNLHREDCSLLSLNQREDSSSLCLKQVDSVLLSLHRQDSSTLSLEEKEDSSLLSLHPMVDSSSSSLCFKQVDSVLLNVHSQSDQGTQKVMTSHNRREGQETIAEGQGHDIIHGHVMNQDILPNHHMIDGDSCDDGEVLLLPEHHKVVSNDEGQYDNTRDGCSSEPTLGITHTHMMSLNDKSTKEMSEDDEGGVSQNQQCDDQNSEDDKHQHNNPQLMMKYRSGNNERVINRSGRSLIQILKPSVNKNSDKRVFKPTRRKSKLELAKLHNKSQLGIAEFLQKREGKSGGSNKLLAGREGGGGVE